MELIRIAAVIVIVAGSALVGLILWSACALSGNISEEEERNG